MSSYYIMPVTSQTLGGQTMFAPKYLQTDMSGLGFSCIPYGQEGWAIVALAAANAALLNEVDVFAFGNDMSEQMQSGDVAAFTEFLSAANVPSDQFVVGMTWAEALQILATIFLAAQAISGAQGTAIFQDGSTTLDTAISDSSISALAPQPQLNMHGAGNLDNAGSGGSSQQVTGNGPFDFTGIASSDSVGATLDSLSQQFSGSVVL